jgi:phosphohistidine phosphatase
VRRLTLMRHGDARWKDQGLSDLERPLNRRGAAAVEAMARRLLELELIPDLMLVSPARRTQQTAEILARELSIPARRVVREERLYLAGVNDLLEVVQGSGPRIAHLLLVGHNPGMSELAQLLVSEGSASSLATAAVCSIAFRADGWEGIGAAEVTDVQRETPPRKLFSLFG